MNTRAAKISIGLMVFLFCAPSAQSWIRSSDSGTAGAAVLKISTDGRGTAMGEAQSAVASGVNAIFWNPAQLWTLQQPEASLSHVLWLENIHMDHIAYAHPMPFGTLGASVNFLYMESISRLDHLGNPHGSFMPWDLVATVSYGSQIDLQPLGVASLPLGLKNLAGGMNLKLVTSTLDDVTAMGLAFDAGATVDMPGLGLRYALVLENAGSKMKYIRDSAPMPFCMKLGIAWQWQQLVAALDFGLPSDNEMYANTGLELRWPAGPEWVFSPRLGYRTTSGTRSLASWAGMSMGVGVDYQEYSLDYSWAPMEVLGSIHRLSVVYHFSGPLPTDEKTKPRQTGKQK